MSTELWRALREDSTAPAYYLGTWRSVSPAETLRRITPLLGPAGITRLADITRLDTIGLPVFQAIRPNSRNISLSNGKGLTRAQAKVSALMEALETYHAEHLNEPVRQETIRFLGREVNYDPYSLAVVHSAAAGACRNVDYDPFLPPLGSPSYLCDDTPIDWVRATDLGNGGCRWVPLQLCEMDFSIEERLCMPFFRATSNGLASGNREAEALIHGLCEVIERDCYWRNNRAWRDPERCIALDTIANPQAGLIVKRFVRARLKTQIVNLTGPMGLPCFEVYLSDRDCAVYKGYGCHPSRDTALIRALTEVAQVRLGHIAGARDDLYRETYRSALHLPGLKESAIFAVKPRGSLLNCPYQAMGSWIATLDNIVHRVRAVTGASPLAVDFTRPDFGLPVVKVIAPGLGFLPPQR